MQQYKPSHEWGTFLWSFIHTLALIEGPIVVECIQNIAKTIPCTTCRCEFEEALSDLTDKNIFEWTVNLHNKVNKRIGKPELTLQQALEKWAVKC